MDAWLKLMAHHIPPIMMILRMACWQLLGIRRRVTANMAVIVAVKVNAKATRIPHCISFDHT